MYCLPPVVVVSQAGVLSPLSGALFILSEEHTSSFPKLSLPYRTGAVSHFNHFERDLRELGDNCSTLLTL